MTGFRATGFAAALLMGLAGLATPASAGEVNGLWRTPVDAGVVRIEPCGGAICGRTVNSATLATHPDTTDLKNRDPALRSRPIKGLVILRLQPLGGDRWGEGWIYNPKDGGTYQASMQLQDAQRLKVTGCAAV